MEDNPKAVLIGDLNMLRSFSEIKDDVVLIVDSKDEVSRYSRMAHDVRIIEFEKLSDLEIVGNLVDVARDFSSQPILFYGDDRVLLLISRHRKELQKWYKYIVPEEGLLESCTDKQHFISVAKEQNLITPRSISSSEIGDISRVESVIGFPCIIKPAVHIDWYKHRVMQSGSRIPAKILLASNQKELDDWLTNFSKNDEFIIQEYIPGGEDVIYSFHAFMDDRSEPLACYVGKKIRTYPSVGGVSTYLRLVKNEEIIRLGLEVIRKLKLTGPVKIDFKKHEANGKYYLLETNLRFNLWNYLGTACGINVPLTAYHYLSGQPYQVSTEYNTNIRWLSFGDDFRSFVRCYHPEGSYTIWAWIRSLMKPKVCDIFAWNDPIPFVMSIWKYTRALMKPVRR